MLGLFFKRESRAMYSFFIVCCMVFNMELVTSTTCDAIPTSLSSLKSCEDNLCLVHQLASIKLPLKPGSSICLEFIPPDGVSPSIPVNITLDYSYSTFDHLYCYFTDDVVQDIKTVCKCPGHSAITDSNCPATVGFNDVSVLQSGTDVDKHCVLGALGRSGTWCTKVGLSGKNRYKVCQMKSVHDVMIQLTVRHGNETWSVPYSGELQSIVHETAPFNVTIVDHISDKEFIPNFIVWDITSPSDAFFLDSTVVNGIDEFSPDKIGWFKSNLPQKISPTLKNSLRTTIKECEVQEGVTAASAQLFVRQTKDLLMNHEVLRGDRIVPGYLIQDPNFNNEARMSNPNLFASYSPYHMMENGFMYMYYNYPNFVGRTLEGYLVPTPEPLASTITLCNVLTDKGVISNSTYTYFGDTITDIETGNSVRFLLVHEPTLDAMGWCTYTVNPAVTNCPDMSGYDSTMICANWSLAILEWPDMTPAIVTYDGRFKLTHVGENIVNDTTTWIPMTSGVLDLIIEFSNMSIQFETFTIRPFIETVQQQDKSIIVKARSTTVGGTCYIGSEPPGVFITQPILLTIKSESYTYNIEKTNVNATYKIGIRCYKQYQYKELKIVSDLEVNQTDPTPEQDSGVISDTYTDLFSGISKWRLPSVFKKWPWNLSWLDMLIWIAEIILLIIIAVVIFVVGIAIFKLIYRIIPKSKFKIRMWYPMRSSTPKYRTDNPFVFKKNN